MEQVQGKGGCFAIYLELGCSPSSAAELELCWGMKELCIIEADQERYNRDWRDGFVFESTKYSSREPEFKSKHPCAYKCL